MTFDKVPASIMEFHYTEFDLQSLGSCRSVLFSCSFVCVAVLSTMEIILQKGILGVLCVSIQEEIIGPL